MPIAPPRLVIDTQVALDMLVFADRSVQPLLHALREGRAIWLAASAQRAEWTWVTSAERCARWGVEPQATRAAFDALTLSVADPGARPAAVPCCRDPDDQPFIDLACAQRADALISRDKAVLALRRKLATGFGIAVRHPKDWLPGEPGAH